MTPLTRSLAAISFAAALTALSAPAARAQAFDFDTTPVGFYAGSLVVTNSGQTLTVTTEGFPNGFVAIVDTFHPPFQGARSLIGSQINELVANLFAPVRMTFDLPVGDITFRFGDGGGDNDTPVTIQAFSSSNVLLGTLNDTYDAGFADGKTIAGSFSGAKYFILSSAPGDNDNSIFWEVASSTPFRGGGNGAPEPGSVMLLFAGIGAVGLVRRLR